MAFDDHTYKWIVKQALGSSIVKNEKDVLKISAGYTKYKQMPAAGTTTAVHAAATLSTSAATTITTGFTNPDVPRVVSITGNNAGVTGLVQVTGTNVEGKTIVDNIVSNGSSTVNGVLAFKSVTKVVVPIQGAAFTLAVGTANILGLYHRLEPSQFTMRVVTDTTSASTSMDNQAFDAAPTVVANEGLVEKNTVQPVTAPNGSTWFRIYYAIFSWSLNNQDPDEIYFTSTSTSSTSSSTSTTTITTSTSSTSTSVSSTSSSTSSTSSTSSSTSTSSTSTSTTTLP